MKIQNSQHAAHILLSNMSCLDRKTGGQEPDHSFNQHDLASLSHHVPRDQAQRMSPLLVDELKQAARLFANHPEEFARLDTAAGIMPPDGRAGRLDLTALASQSLSYEDSVHIVADNFPFLDQAAGLGSADYRFGRQDLEAAVHRDDTPTELREASYYLLSHPEQFERLGNTAGMGDPRDGYVGTHDIRSFLLHEQYAHLMAGVNL